MSSKPKKNLYSKEDWNYLNLIRAKQWPQNHSNIIHNTLNKNITTNIIYGNGSTWSITKTGLDYFRNNFITKPNDIIITSYPRSGTHWVMKICLEIIQNCSINVDLLPPEYKYCDYRFIPQIDTMISKPNGMKALNKFMIRYDNKYKCQKIYFTHLPFHLFPKQINKNTKIIHIVREPKDIVVSSYKFFINMNKEGLFPDANIKFDNFFDLFMKGYFFGGNYWDSYISWYLQLNNLNILWLFYEDILLNPKKEITKISKFLGLGNGNKYLDINILNNENVINKIVSLCTFESLKKNAKKGWKSVFRKGKIGDWKHYLNNQQIQRINQTTKNKFHQMSHCIYYKQLLSKL